MTLSNFWVGLAVLMLPLAAQTPNDALTIKPPAKLTVSRGGTATAVLEVTLNPGYHVNSNKPLEDYLIPLRLMWDLKPLEAEAITYPKPELHTYSFSAKPLSVYTGSFQIETKFRVPADAPTGLSIAGGRLRYQACTDKMCLPPKSATVSLPMEIR